MFSRAMMMQKESWKQWGDNYEILNAKKIVSDFLFLPISLSDITFSEASVSLK